jgi:hypothetical protein
VIANIHPAGGFKHLFIPFHIWDVILPIDLSYCSRWFLHHQPDIVFLNSTMILIGFHIGWLRRVGTTNKRIIVLIIHFGVMPLLLVE